MNFLYARVFVMRFSYLSIFWCGRACVVRGVSIGIGGTADAIRLRFPESLEWQECVGDANLLQLK